MLQQDTFQHKGLRKKLVEEVEAKGITDKRVLEALLKVPLQARWARAQCSRLYCQPV